MSWQDDIDAAREELRAAGRAKEAAASDAEADEAARLARFRPQVVAVRRVRRALERIRWKGASQHRDGLVRVVSVGMDVPEVAWEAGGADVGYSQMKAGITYYKRRTGTRGYRVHVHAGHAGWRHDDIVDDVWFSGDLCWQVTPELIQRAAARWSVEHSIDLRLGSPEHVSGTRTLGL